MTKLSLRDLPVHGKRVLMRVDFNVPLDAQGNISDDTKIQAALPSIKYVLEHGGKLILMSHLGKTNLKKDPKYSLVKVAAHLSSLLKKPVLMAKDCVGEEVLSQVFALKNGDCLLLENLRFYEAEEHPEKDPLFAKELSSFGDFFVNDAFGAAHRPHSSVVDVAAYFPGKAAAGFLMENEIKFLKNAILNPKRPFCAILGGAKVSSKLSLIQSLLDKVDLILIGGAMAYTFLKSQGLQVGKSLVEDELLEAANNILQEAKSKGVECLLPQDHLMTADLKGKGSIKISTAEEGIPPDYYGVDIGPATIKVYIEKLNKAETVLWNGPLGIFEIPEFSKGTIAIAKDLASLKATTIVGGGESIAALKQAGVTEKISHVSTGGGATLEYLEYGTLPGIEALTEK